MGHTSINGTVDQSNRDGGNLLARQSILLNKIQIHKAFYVMNIEWDYNYYQLWSDNEWLVDEMLAMLDKDIMMH